MEFFDPNTHQIPLEQIRELIDRYIPLEMCRCYGLIPLSKDDRSPPSILVGMMNPDDLEALDRLNWQLKPQGLAVRQIAIAPEHYQPLMQEFLNENASHQPQVQSVRFDVDSKLDAIARFEVRVDETEPDLGVSLQDAGSASIIGTVNTILAKALQEGVSDIHVEPQAEQLRIRFRKDGVLSQAFPPLPRQIIPGVVSRFKIMAGLDIAERRCPQVGRIRRLFQDRKFDLRVSTLPNRFGEKIVVRLQEYAANPLRLEQVMQKAETCALVKTLLQHNSGLILVSGHPYVGGRNTLYAMLAECNTEEKSVCSLENLIEYDFPGVSQTQILQDKGMDYVSCLNALLIQDADVVFIDDIPDQATASTILDAAQSCLVVAGLPIERSEQAVDGLRVRDMEDWKIARSLLGIVNQQLLRRVCPTCRVAYPLRSEELSQFGVSALSTSDTFVYTAKQWTQEERLTNANLCSSCGGTGYQGKIAVHEVMLLTQDLQHLIVRGSAVNEIRNAAIQAGMETGLNRSLELLVQGITTLEEVERTFTRTPLV